VTDERPIGVFDSGFGGLTVARALIDVLPEEHLVYLGDTARYPYGPRPAEEVRRFALEIGRHLVTVENAKLVVVACNTASAAALSLLEAELPIPVVGVIEPGMRAARQATENGRVGVIGTVGTIASGAYQRAAEAAGEEVICAACPGFVEFVERGDTTSDQVHVLAERLLSPLKGAGVDTLLLGCTHYPFLARTIADVMGRGVVLVSSADETAFDVAFLLAGLGLERHGRGPGTHRFLSSGDVELFSELGRRLLGPELHEAEPVTFAPKPRESEDQPNPKAEAEVEGVTGSGARPEGRRPLETPPAGHRSDTVARG
jgi:glutamate racemase